MTGKTHGCTGPEPDPEPGEARVYEPWAHLDRPRFDRDAVARVRDTGLLMHAGSCPAGSDSWEQFKWAATFPQDRRWIPDALARAATAAAPDRDPWVHWPTGPGEGHWLDGRGLCATCGPECSLMDEEEPS